MPFRLEWEKASMIESGRSGKGSEVVFRVDWARQSGMDEEWDGRRVGWTKSGMDEED